MILGAAYTREKRG